MKITLDTNFFISATQWDNSVAHKLLLKFLDIKAEIFTTKKILYEFSEVLQRDFYLTEKEVNEVIERLLLFVTLIEPTEKLEIIKEDPDDNKVLECAASSNSEYILSYDKHLLNLKEFRGIKILAPEEFLNNLIN